MNAIMTIETDNVVEFESYSDWCEHGEQLAKADAKLQWYVGDWWNYGKKEYRDRADEFLDRLSRKYSLTQRTVLNYARVCSRFPKDIRIPELTFKHHQIVVGIDNDEQVVQWLEDARAKGITAEPFRVQVMKERTLLGHFPTSQEVDDDPEHTELVDIARRWNRARKSVRQTFLELANESELEEIDP